MAVAVSVSRERISAVDFLNKNVQFCNARAVNIYTGITSYKNTHDDVAIAEIREVCAKTRGEHPKVRNVAVSYQILTDSFRICVIIAADDDEDAASATVHLIKTLNSATPETIHDKSVNDPNIVQLTASNDEIQKRIQNYINRKREQVNIHNIEEFIQKGQDAEDDSDSTCCRVRSVFVKRKDGNGHLRIHKVQNSWGPQTYKKHIEDTKPFTQTTASDLPIGLAERISSAEKYVNLSASVPKDIYSRLRSIEDRIAHLEATSPEYANFWTKSDTESKFLYKVEDIDKKIKSIMEN